MGEKHGCRYFDACWAWIGSSADNRTLEQFINQQIQQRGNGDKSPIMQGNTPLTCRRINNQNGVHYVSMPLKLRL